MDEDHNYFCDVCTDNLCTDHNVEVIPGSAATCTKNGLTDGERCADCGEILVSQSVISALGHSYSDWVQVKAPTIEEVGLEKRFCVTCGDEEQRELAKLDPVGQWLDDNRMALCIVAIILTCVVATGVAVAAILKKKRST